MHTGDAMSDKVTTVEHAPAATAAKPVAEKPAGRSDVGKLTQPKAEKPKAIGNLIGYSDSEGSSDSEKSMKSPKLQAAPFVSKVQVDACSVAVAVVAAKREHLLASENPQASSWPRPEGQALSRPKCPGPLARGALVAEQALTLASLDGQELSTQELRRFGAKCGPANWRRRVRDRRPASRGAPLGLGQRHRRPAEDDPDFEDFAFFASISSSSVATGSSRLATPEAQRSREPSSASSPGSWTRVEASPEPEHSRTRQGLQFRSPEETLRLDTQRRLEEQQRLRREVERLRAEHLAEEKRRREDKEAERQRDERCRREAEAAEARRVEEHRREEERRVKEAEEDRHRAAEAKRRRVEEEAKRFEEKLRAEEQCLHEKRKRKIDICVGSSAEAGTLAALLRGRAAELISTQVQPEAAPVSTHAAERPSTEGTRVCAHAGALDGSAKRKFAATLPRKHSRSLDKTPNPGWLREGERCDGCSKSVVEQGGVRCRRLRPEGKKVGCDARICWKCMNKAPPIAFGKVRTTKAEFADLGTDAWWMHEKCMQPTDKEAYFATGDDDTGEDNKSFAWE